jgi:indolepyruvate ferredoxin oxidoreductase beta subunit
MGSIIICGVGGQGVLTASNLLSDVLLDAGYDVKKSEVHGMSQRGGDVISTINYGEEVYSPLPSLFETDFILAFEKLEALRNINYLSENGTIMVNDFVWEPLPVASGIETYPDDIPEQLEKISKNVIFIPATDMAKALGNILATNTILLGILASRMGLEKSLWENALKNKIKPKFLDLNLEAFNKGYSHK